MIEPVSLVPAAPSIRDIVAQGQTPAEIATLTFTAMQQLGLRMQGDFVDMAYFAYEVRENALWTHLGKQDWTTFVDDLEIGVSPKQMSILANMWEWFIEKRGMPQAELAAIGSAKAAHLLPTARRGEIDPEIWKAAQEVPARELLIRLGHKPSERDGESQVECKNCGNIIYGARYVSRKKEERDDRDPSQGNRQGYYCQGSASP